MKLKIVGLRVVKYVNQFISGHNCDFEYYPDEDEEYTLFVREVDHECHKYAIHLKNEFGECGSGWCTASWGEMTVKSYTHDTRFGPFNYVPVDEGIFEGNIKRQGDHWILEGNSDDDWDGGDVFVCDYFSYDSVGYDSYYPSGGVSVNMEKFKELPRNMPKRPVWIFYGASGLGKSTLADLISTEKKVYETDSSDTIPDNITADVIVLGNKYNFSIEDIKKHLFGDPMAIPVKFENVKEDC